MRVYASPARSRLLREKDTLDGGDVLPGLAVPPKKFFARATRRRR